MTGWLVGHTSTSTTMNKQIISVMNYENKKPLKITHIIFKSLLTLGYQTCI